MSGKSRHLKSKIAPTPHPPLVASPRPRQNTPFMDGHQLGNNPPVSGKEAVLEINASFFTSIAAMAHTIDRVWLQGAHII